LTYDWLIVGAGFTGATLAERLASECGQKVLVIDRRPHIAGNAFDETDGNGILVQRFGPHIFHTNNKKVWDYLSRFTDWRLYYHRVLCMVDGKTVPVPFNLDSMYALFPPRMADRLAEELVNRFGFGVKVPILKLRETSGKELNWLASYIYEKVFLHYTEKQWGMKPDELDPSVTERVPVHISRDDRYFQDTHQAMPVEGFTAMIKKILDHPNICVQLNTEYTSLPADTAKRTIFTGPIDEFFGNEYGALPYRSLRFEYMTENCRHYLPATSVNYPNEYDFTRLTEAKYLSGQDDMPVTTVIYEYSLAYQQARNEPYYPIPSPGSHAKLKPYLKKADGLKGKIWFAGRLGDYKYYNMDQACTRALELFETELAPICGK